MKNIVKAVAFLLPVMGYTQCPFDPLINENDTIICTGTTITLSTQTYDSYQWYLSYSSTGIGSPIAGETGQTLVVDDFGYYTVEATLGGCTEFSNTVLVDMYAFLNPAVISSGQSTFCAGDSSMIEITFGNWTNIQWLQDGVPIPGANNNSYWVDQSGTYVVNASPGQCPNLTLTSGVGPSFTFLTPVVPTITWDLVDLNSSSANSYQWNLNGSPISGANGQSYTPTVTGVYSVTTVDANGCSATSDTMTVEICTYDPLIGQADTMICPGDSVYLTTQSYDSYQWYKSLSPSSIGNPVGGGNGQGLYIQDPGYYTVLTTLAGCATYSNTVFVNLFSFTDPTVVSSGQTDFCVGDSTLIEVSPTNWGNIQWLLDGNPIPGATGTAYYAGQTGTYTVQTSPAECPNLQFADLTGQSLIFHTPVVPAISWNGTELTSTAASTYQWNLNGSPVTGATNQTHVPLSGGIYSVTTTDQNGCEATSDTLQVTLDADGIGEWDQEIRLNYQSTYLEVICSSPVQSLTLWTIDGKTIRSEKNGENIISLQGLPSGTYILTVQTNGRAYSKKLTTYNQ